MGLPEKPASEMEPTPTAPAAAETQPSKAPSAAPVSPSDTKPVKVGESAGKSAMLKAMDDNKITDPTARASIMAQVGHESGNFTTLSENLNYKAPTLMKLFPKKFAGEQDAQAVAAGGPEKVAERLYAGRMGNAPEGSGEGFMYRGRGFVQLTGKQNYTKFGFASNPDAVSEPANAASTAIKYMLGYKGDWSDITKVTKFVNGGTIGLEDRLKHFKAYLNDPKITTVGAASTVPSGGSVSSASTQVAADQRQQQKPQTPVIINAPSTTNTTVVKNETKAAPVNTATGGANALLARAT
jgi:putative chitinase